MRFWDTSAVVPLLVAEQGSAVARTLFEEDPALIVWWGTPVECVSAIARRERERALDAGEARAALARLDALRERWHEVQPGEAIQTLARRLLRVHPLRAADALQLAAAAHASEGAHASLPLVTLDARLLDAASREGFPVLPQ